MLGSVKLNKKKERRNNLKPRVANFSKGNLLCFCQTHTHVYDHQNVKKVKSTDGLQF